jgi:hypothetical protein
MFRGGQSGAEAGFLRVLRFPLPIFIPRIAPQSPSSIIWGLYNRPEVAAVPRELVPPHQLKKKNMFPTDFLTKKCIGCSLCRRVDRSYNLCVCIK